MDAKPILQYNPCVWENGELVKFKNVVNCAVRYFYLAVIALVYFVVMNVKKKEELKNKQITEIFFVCTVIKNQKEQIIRKVNFCSVP